MPLKARKILIFASHFLRLRNETSTARLLRPEQISGGKVKTKL